MKWIVLILFTYVAPRYIQNLLITILSKWNIIHLGASAILCVRRLGNGETAFGYQMKLQNPNSASPTQNVHYRSLVWTHCGLGLFPGVLLSVS